MKIRRADYYNLACSLGLSIIELMRDLTPGELNDLIKLRSKGYEKNAK